MVILTAFQGILWMGNAFKFVTIKGVINDKFSSDSYYECCQRI